MKGKKQGISLRRAQIQSNNVRREIRECRQIIESPHYPDTVREIAVVKLEKLLKSL